MVDRPVDLAQTNLHTGLLRMSSPHDYLRAGTATLLTLFHSASGEVRVKGMPTCPNAVLHPWLQAELTTMLAGASWSEGWLLP